MTTKNKIAPELHEMLQGLDMEWAEVCRKELRRLVAVFRAAQVPCRCRDSHEHELPGCPIRKAFGR